VSTEVSYVYTASIFIIDKPRAICWYSILYVMTKKDITYFGLIYVKLAYKYAVHPFPICVGIKQDITVLFHFSTHVSEFSTLHYSGIITPLKTSFI
jgi:hypothetical protein